MSDPPDNGRDGSKSTKTDTSKSTKTDTSNDANITSTDVGAGDDEAPFLLTERDTDEGRLVAVCDADILGDTFGNGSVSLTVNEEFYGGDRADEEAVVASLRGAQVANLVGERVVSVAVEAGIVDGDTVLEVGATRHAQLVRM
jgi:hypothetical protein